MANDVLKVAAKAKAAKEVDARVFRDRFYEVTVSQRWPFFCTDEFPLARNAARHPKRLRTSSVACEFSSQVRMMSHSSRIDGRWVGQRGMDLIADYRKLAKLNQMPANRLSKNLDIVR